MIYMTKCNTFCTTEIVDIDDITFPQKANVDLKLYKRAKSGLFYPPHKAFDRIITQDLIDYVNNNPVEGKTAFLFAAGSQGWGPNSGKYDQNPDALLHHKCKIPFITLTNIYAGRIASVFHVKDHVSTDASACASSLKIMMDMQHLFHLYGFDRAIVMAGEDSTNVQTLEFFGEANGHIPLESDRVPSAFDSENYGFHVGQGCAIAVFEKEHKNMADPLCKFLGAYAAAEDNTNPLGQREDGDGYYKAIQGALGVAKVDPKKVNLVKTHGTGTQMNNKSERAALERSLSDFIATSYKPSIGHTLSASGLMETGLLLNDMKRGIVPKILNRTERDDVFLSHDAPVPDKGPFMSLAAGMGNTYAAAVFSTEV